MEEEQKKQFTGVWIPRHILEDKRLKPAARLIYAEISCFEVCSMSNETLGERAGVSQSQANRVIKQLKELGYIETLGFNGRIRKMRSLYDKKIPPTQNAESAYAKTTSLPTQNDTEDNSIDNKEIKTLDKSNEAKPYGKPEINELFNYWEDTVGYKIPSRIQANRNACNNLLNKHGKDSLMQLVRGVALSQNDRYAPRIVDFASLQQKTADLIVWGRKRGSDETAQF